MTETVDIAVGCFSNDYPQQNQIAIKQQAGLLACGSPNERNEVFLTANPC